MSNLDKLFQSKLLQISNLTFQRLKYLLNGGILEKLKTGLSVYMSMV